MSEVIIAAVQIGPAALVFAILYFIFIRPQRREINAHKKALKKLKVGDHIFTESGMLGRVDEFLGANLLRLKIAPDLAIVIQRKAVATVAPPDKTLEAFLALAQPTSKLG